jgi:hypothetical protein
MSFGFSVGDFVAAGELLSTIIKEISFIKEKYSYDLEEFHQLFIACHDLFGDAGRIGLEYLQEQELVDLTQAVDECRPILIAVLELFKSYTAFFFRYQVSSHLDIESSTGWQSERPPEWGEKRRGLFRNLRTTVVPRMMIISIIAKEVGE